MKRILASAGLVALGAASVQAQYTPGTPPIEQTKWWSASLAVLGFYDSNMYSAPSDSGRDESSWGMAVTPTFGINYNLERTVITFNIEYTARWYEARTENETDQTVAFGLGVEHSFSERYKLVVNDRFVYSDEGQVYLDQPQTVLGRSDGTYTFNNGKIMFDAGLTERFSVDVGYANQFWSFEDDGYAGLLDRLENKAIVEAVYQLQPDTDILLGYNYKWVNYTGDGYAGLSGMIPSDARNYNGNFIYAGVEHQFSPQLTTALRAGVEIDTFNDIPANVQGIYDDEYTQPYIDWVLGYAYNPGSWINVGVVNTMNSTDVGSALSQSSVAAYFDWNHRLGGPWNIGAMGLYQHSNYNGGLYDDDSDQLFVGGVDLSYNFNKNLRAEASYRYDKLNSDLPGREFDRNRVNFGLRAMF